MRPGFILAAALLVGRCAAVGSAAHAGSLPEMPRDLAPRWWQWRVSLPELAVPNRDAAGHFCDVGQSGDTWFLGNILTFGAAQGALRRRCVIPSGRALFFPVLTGLRIVNGDVTCERAVAQVSEQVGAARNLHVTLDGASLPVTPENRWATGACFPLRLRADGPSSGLLAAADGYWMMVPPLAAGHHSLSWGGEFGSADDSRETLYELDVR